MIACDIQGRCHNCRRPFKRMQPVKLYKYVWYCLTCYSGIILIRRNNKNKKGRK